MPNYYPIMLDIRKRPAIVIGGDPIAAQKTAALVASGALVTVQSTEFCDELLAMSQRNEIVLHHKTYEAGDLAGAFVVVAATNDRTLIEAIWQETHERGQLVNIVDVPARCNFIVPSILRRGQLTIAVSTEGASPALAKRIRQRLEGLFPSAYEGYLQLASIIRAHLRKQHVSYEQRDEFFGVFFESNILQLLIEGDEAGAIATTLQILHDHGIDITAETITNELGEAVSNNGNYTTA
jgi:precorrin-2 dehydrogenase/sirohydrochlorin ferrochelatase